MTSTLQRPETVPAAAARSARSGRRFSSFQLVSWVAAAVVVAFIVYPVGRAFIGELGMELPAVVGVLTSAKTLEVLRNAVVAVALGGGLAFLIGAVLAWINVRTDARMGWAAEALPLMPLFVPAIAGSIGWVFLATPEAGFLNHWLRKLLGLVGDDLETGPLDIFTWPGLVFVYALYLTPYAYLALSSGLQSLDPALEEAARVSGCGPVKTLFRVTLPNLKPAMGAAVLQLITIGFALFSVPVVIGTSAQIQVLPVSIVQAVTRKYPPDLITALSMSLILITIVVVAWSVERRIMAKGRFARIGGRGARAALVSLGRWKLPARLLVLGYLGATSVLPFLALLLVSFQGFWTPQVDFGALSGDNYVDLWGRLAVRRGITNSLLLALLTATITTLLAALLAYLSYRRRSFLGRLVDGVIKVPAAISHIVVGIAFLVAFAGPPFGWNGTLLLLVSTYVVIFLPQASFYANSAIQQIGPEMREAAEVSGARDWRVFLRVILPLMAPSLVAGWSLLFILSAGEINASAMLAGPGSPVVGQAILDLWTAGTFPLLASLSVVITVVSTAVVLTVLALGGRPNSGSAP